MDLMNVTCSNLYSVCNYVENSARKLIDKIVGFSKIMFEKISRCIQNLYHWVCPVIIQNGPRAPGYLTDFSKPEPMRPVDYLEDFCEIDDDKLRTTLHRLRKDGFFDGLMDASLRAERLQSQSVFQALDLERPNVSKSKMKGPREFLNYDVQLDTTAGILFAGMDVRKGCERIHHLKLECYTSSKLNDSELQQLVEAFPNLESLSFDCNSTTITDAGLLHLQKLPHLTKLNLTGCKKITDEGLKSLQSLTKLTKLSLDDCKRITNDGLGYLQPLSNLTHLRVAGCPQITDKGIESLYALSLQSIHLDAEGDYDLDEVERHIPEVSFRPASSEITVEEEWTTPESDFGLYR